MFISGSDIHCVCSMVKFGRILMWSHDGVVKIIPSTTVAFLLFPPGHAGGQVCHLKECFRMVLSTTLIIGNARHES